jgi:hypothetical protein
MIKSERFIRINTSTNIFTTIVRIVIYHAFGVELKPQPREVG